MADYQSSHSGPTIDERVTLAATNQADIAALKLRMSSAETSINNKADTSTVNAALATKQNTLVSGTNIKTVGGQNILGSGNIPVNDENAVKFVAQTLTDAQKAQARTNIDAASTEEVSQLQQEVTADVSQLEAKVGDYDFSSSSPSFTMSDGYLSWVDGVVGTSTAVKSSSAIAVGGYDVVEFEGSTPASDSALGGAAFYDSNGNFLSSFRYEQGGLQNGHKTYRIEIPDGAATFKFSIYTDFVSYAKVTLYRGDTVISSIDKEKNETIQDEELTVRIVDVNSYGGWHRGYVQWNNGINYDYNGAPTMFTDYVDISGYKKIRFPQTNQPSQSDAGAAFYDENKTYISGVRQYYGADQITIQDREVYVPKDAKYIRATIYGTRRGDFYLDGIVSKSGVEDIVDDVKFALDTSWSYRRLDAAGGPGTIPGIQVDGYSRYILSDAFPVKSGDIINVNSRGYGVCFVAECDSSGSNMVARIVGPNLSDPDELYLGRYVASNDGYVRVCCRQDLSGAYVQYLGNNNPVVSEIKRINAEVNSVSKNRAGSQKLIGAMYFDAYNAAQEPYLNGLWDDMSETDLPGKNDYDNYWDYAYDNDGVFPARDCSAAMYYPNAVPSPTVENPRLVRGLPSRKPFWGWLRKPATMGGYVEYKNGVPTGRRNDITDTSKIRYTLEDEIALASNYGIDFFCFCFYVSPSDFDEDNIVGSRLSEKPSHDAIYGMMAASNKYKMKFCVMPVFHSSEENLSEKQMFSFFEYIAQTFFTDSSYLYMNGRPVLPLYSWITATRLNANMRIKGSAIIRQYSFSNADSYDGIFSYSGGHNGTASDSEYTYEQLSDGNKSLCDSTIAKANVQMPFFPVTFGWDDRARQSFGWTMAYFARPTKSQLVDALKYSIDAAEKNSFGDKCITLYAWNEYGEGGWLPPVESETTTTENDYPVMEADGVTQKTDGNGNPLYYDFFRLEAVLEAKTYWKTL